MHFSLLLLKWQVHEKDLLYFLLGETFGSKIFASFSNQTANNPINANFTNHTFNLTRVCTKFKCFMVAFFFLFSKSGTFLCGFSSQNLKSKSFIRLLFGSKIFKLCFPSAFGFVVIARGSFSVETRPCRLWITFCILNGVSGFLTNELCLRTEYCC